MPRTRTPCPTGASIPIWTWRLIINSDLKDRLGHRLGTVHLHLDPVGVPGKDHQEAFHLPHAAIAKYWNDISDAAPNTDFVIYNIPQLAGVALTAPLLKEMLKNPRVIGVKNSSMPVQDIQMWTEIFRPPVSACP